MPERCTTCHKFRAKDGCKYCAKHGGSIKSNVKHQIQVLKDHGFTAFNSAGKRYNYLGPGNAMLGKEPINALDAAAKLHDEAYDRLGKQAYWRHSNADDKLIKATEGETGRNAKIVRGIFKTKKKINEILGIKPLHDDIKGEGKRRRRRRTTKQH